MKIGKFRRLAILSVFMVSLGMIGCGNFTVSKETNDESKVNLTTVLKYKKLSPIYVIVGSAVVGIAAGYIFNIPV